MALTKDVNTPEREGALVSRPAAGGARVFAGSMVAVSAGGNASSAANAPGLKVIGRAEAAVDNSAGIAGEKTVTVKRGVFRFANSATQPLGNADIFGTAYVEDDGTVAKITTNSIPAGKVIDIDTDGVWVEIK